MSRPYAGLGGCEYCGLQVLYALDVNGDLTALDEGADGPVAVRKDCAGTPRIRRVPPWRELADGESRAGLHNDACIGLAEVVSIGRAPSLRRCTRPAPVRRTASAR